MLLCYAVCAIYRCFGFCHLDLGGGRRCKLLLAWARVCCPSALG